MQKSGFKSSKLKLVLTSLALIGSFSFIACNKSDGGGSSASTPNGYASTPQPCNYQNSNSPFGPAPSNCSAYSNYYSGSTQNYAWSNGAWIWPTQYMASQGSCGCPSGYFPVQSAYYGVACAPNAYQNAYGNGYYGGGGGLIYFSIGTWGANWGGGGWQPYWNYSQNGGWLNRPQAVYQPAVSTSNSCGSSTAQGCDVRVNSCPSGSRCQPVAGGSTIGLCVR